MKKLQWILVSGIWALQNPPVFCENTLTAERPSGTIIDTRGNNGGTTTPSHSLVDKVPMFEPRLYTEAAHAQQFEGINSLYGKADAFLFCYQIDKIFCQFKSRHQPFLENTDGGRTSPLFSREQIQRRLRPEVVKGLLVIQFAYGGTGAIVRDPTQQEMTHLTAQLGEMSGFIDELGFERVLVLLPHLGTTPSEWQGVLRHNLDGYYIFMDRLKSRN